MNERERIQRRLKNEDRTMERQELFKRLFKLERAGPQKQSAQEPAKKKALSR